MKTAYSDMTPFVTKDGSVIRELIHPAVHGTGTLSFAEATVAAGETTQLHFHRNAEEIYHITQGAGRMRLGETEFDIRRGDTITIAPGTRHNVTNSGSEALIILCACHPAYSDEDTVLL